MCGIDKIEHCHACLYLEKHTHQVYIMWFIVPDGACSVESVDSNVDYS